MNQSHPYTSLFQNQVDSLYGFLLNVSIPLSNYFLFKKNKKETIEAVKQVCSSSVFFLRMKDASSLVMADEKTRLIMRVTQDFLYGINEISCQDCACDQISYEQKEALFSSMVQKYAQRILSFCDLVHYETLLPHDFAQLFMENLNVLVQRKKDHELICQDFLQYSDIIDRDLLIQAYVFVNYIVCLNMD